MKFILGAIVGVVTATALSVAAGHLVETNASRLSQGSEKLILNAGDRLICAINPGTYTLGSGVEIVDHVQRAASTFTGSIYISGSVK